MTYGLSMSPLWKIGNYCKRKVWDWDLVPQKNNWMNKQKAGQQSQMENDLWINANARAVHKETNTPELRVRRRSDSKFYSISAFFLALMVIHYICMRQCLFCICSSVIKNYKREKAGWRVWMKATTKAQVPFERGRRSLDCHGETVLEGYLY